MTTNEQRAAERAIELALGGWGRVAPNPLVGAVLLRDDEVIGEGCHEEFGGPHAEVAALSQVSDATGATCVVNLEPCAHHGKTPPCTDALIEAGVRRVMYSVPDPGAQSGGGAAVLRAGGVEVVAGIADVQAAALNGPFLFNQLRRDRPFVAVKLATSLDGYVADIAGVSQWISGEEARDYVHWLRAGFEGIAVGRRTAVRDDPLLTVRGPVEPRVQPVRIVFGTTGKLPADLRMLAAAETTPTIVVLSPDAPAAVRHDLQAVGATVLATDRLEDALAYLRESGLGSILVEGGGGIATALLERGLVDRLYWIQSPIWLGDGTPAFGRRGWTPLDQARRWTVTERRALGSDTLLVADQRLCLQGS